MDEARFSPRSKSKCRAVCSVIGCKSRLNKDLDVVFHRLPPAGKRFVPYKNKFGNIEKTDQLIAWKDALKLKRIYPSSRVCSLHFQKDDYSLPNVAAKYRILMKNAVPSNNLPGNNQITRKRKPRLADQSIKEEEIINEVGDVKLLPILEVNVNEWTGNIKPIHSGRVKQDVGIQPPSNYQPKFTNFITNDGELDALTGIESFQILRTIVEMTSTSLADKSKHTDFTIDIYDRVIMTYVKLKQNLSFNCLAILFQCYCAKFLQRVFKEMIQILNDCLKLVIKWPSKETAFRNLTKCFEGFEDVKVILSCIEMPTVCQKNVSCQLINASNFKKSQTIKFMIGVSPDGIISYISRAYGGKASHTDIFINSDILNLLESHDGIMADKDFMIDEICNENHWTCYRPSFLRGQNESCKAEAILACKIAKARAYADRLNKKIKSFKIVTDNMPVDLLQHVEHIFTIICATINLCSPVIPNEEFMLNIIVDS